MVLNDEVCLTVGKALLNYCSIIDRHGDYKHAGALIREISGYSIQEIQGTNISQYLHKEDRAVALEMFAGVPLGQTALLGPFRFYIRNGNYRWVEAQLTNLLDHPQVEGYLMSCKDVTDSVETAHIRKKVTTSYSNFFSKHPFGVVHMQMDGTIDMINPKINQDLGYSLANAEERSLISFFLPQYRRTVIKCYNKARMHGQAESFDVEVYKSNDEPLHVNLTIVPVVHEGQTIEIYVVVKDISDRHTLQENLKRTSLVADKTNNGVAIMDMDGRIEWVNNGFSQMNGYTMDEAIGKRPAELLGSNMTQIRRQQMWNQLLAGKPFTKEVLCMKKDGTPYWNLIEITPVLGRNDQLERLIAIHTDITKTKKAEQDLKVFAQDLYKRNKELQQFGYIVSHNLRSPVANIMGIANILELDRDKPETVDTCIHHLQKAIGNMDTVIRDLSKILSAGNASIELTKECIDLTEMLTSIKTELTCSSRQSDTEIIIPEVAHILHSHKAYLYSIFYNLISNAIKYRSDRKPVIEVSIVKGVRSITIAVHDNGLGIDLKKHKENIFMPYKRFSPGIEGKGLGLFLVKSHVEYLNGKISVESELGKGTTFTIVLPLNLK